LSRRAIPAQLLVRPALEKPRERAAAGAFERLYVCGPDRVARDFAHQNLLTDELERADVEVVFLQGNTVFASSQQRRRFHD
jgi:DNA invertase Pin-like site-specific DNA recombinase